MADDDGIRVLFGPGGYLRVTIYGEAEDHPKQLDLTTFAEPLVRAGIERTRRAARAAAVDARGKPWLRSPRPEGLAHGTWSTGCGIAQPQRNV